MERCETGLSARRIGYKDEIAGGPGRLCSSTSRTPGKFSAATRSARLSSSDWLWENQKCTTRSLTRMSAAQILDQCCILNHSCPFSSESSFWRMVRSSLSALVAGSVLCRRQCPHEIRPADDFNELAVAHNRHALDPFCLEQHSVR